MLTRVPAHPTPTGPLAVRWLAYDLPPVRAGAKFVARIELENAGAATWREEPGASVNASYHWLDRLGNAIIWEGRRTPLPLPIAPGQAVAVDLRAEAPVPPGRYRFAVDLVAEGRAWFSDIGNQLLERDVDVAPRIRRRALSVHVGDGPPKLVEATWAALEGQAEPLADHGEATAFLAPGCAPAPDWSARILDAHEEGFAVVAGSIEVHGLLGRRRASALAPWRPGFGRAPGWSRPLLCPSLVTEAAERAPWTDFVAGLPALDQSRLDEPWLCDGRIRVRVAARALPRAGRRPA